MGEDIRTPEAHVVVANTPDKDGSIVGPALYAVVTHTPEQAEAAVQEVVSPESTVEVTGGPLKPETAERLALVPGQAKQIG